MTSRNVLDIIEDSSDEMKDSLMEMIKYPSVGPDNDGEGEMLRAAYLMDLIEPFAFDIVERYDAPDERASSGKRPNIMAVKEGKKDRDLVIIAHIDIVPEGDLKEWEIEPFAPVFEDGKIYGRGTEDNGQEVIAALYAAKAFSEAEMKPDLNLKVFLVSDEETGSEYGVDHILEEGLIDEDDLVVVPDHSEDRGKKAEVVEKSALWVKITVHGKQGHAAIPKGTINSRRVAAEYQKKVDDRLHEKHDETNNLFSPDSSTFEPTKIEANVPNVNTLPGQDVQYFDCRILPTIELDDVKQTFEEIASEVEEKYGAQIELDYIKESPAPKGTPEDSEIVTRLQDSVEKIRGFRPEPVGIGGGTVASQLRKIGIDAVVWCTNEELAHQPNEYAILDYMVDDCKVFADMLID